MREIIALDRDEARLALWKAIGNIKSGNKTDDKLILQELHALGFYICKFEKPETKEPQQ